MYCRACESEVSTESRFCHNCGAPIPIDGSESIKHPAVPPVVSRFANSSVDTAEFDLWRGNYSSKAMLAHAVTAAIASALALIVCAVAGATAEVWSIVVIMILLVWLVMGLVLGFRKLNVSYHLSNRRFIHQRGILRRYTDQIEVIDMDDISYEQGIIERLLNIGSVRVNSSDRTHPEIELIGIENVAEVAGIFDEARRKERMQRGIHIESI